MGATEEAVELKEKGNKAFKEHDWPKAISFYTQAIEKNDQEPAFFTNRAQVSCLIAGQARDLSLQAANLTPCIGEHQTRVVRARHNRCRQGHRHRPE
jgi:hypothetical protein